MQSLDVVLHSLYKLGLIFSDGATDVRPHKQRVEAGEDTEHLVGVLGSAELIPQTCGDAGLHTVDSLIIPTTIILCKHQSDIGMCPTKQTSYFNILIHKLH